ncbi:hypothetical protein [Candidatus Enterococcus clewellii]|uniref:Uncharacterized protein n=1 Tax=Candidatus Enterococcus clewellii TaxID=1834193 RepID=A0A242K958_9ENTE|nr:hypothetical protein [Enterococcus sp. 9E7_DIV0242]OTP17597.1 hypothetical protein A5888_001735 [Enterococcus sp. 9E7_DIV0242]
MGRKEKRKEEKLNKRQSVLIIINLIIALINLITKLIEMLEKLLSQP